MLHDAVSRATLTPVVVSNGLNIGAVRLDTAVYCLSAPGSKKSR